MEITLTPYNINLTPSEIKIKVYTSGCVSDGVTVHNNLSGRDATDTHPIASITGLVTALGNKVDKVTGKGLSTNDYTTAEKNKLTGIEEGAEVNPENSDFTLAGLGEKSYNNLTDKPDLSQLHTQNTDTILDEDGTNEVSAQEIREHIDDADIHFEINDSIASTSSVYSSDKVGTLLSGKENSLGFTPTQKLTATITIAVADWSGGLTCTKAVPGLLPTDTVIRAMDGANATLYGDAKIFGDSSVAGEITFTCTTTPTSEIVIPLEIIR